MKIQNQSLFVKLNHLVGLQMEAAAIFRSSTKANCILTVRRPLRDISGVGRHMTSTVIGDGVTVVGKGSV